MDQVLSYLQPVDRDDAITMIHDIEYLMYSDNKEFIRKSDSHAIQQASLRPHGLTIKFGLTMGKLLDLDYYTTNVPPRVGFLLRDFVTKDPVWNATLKHYNVTFGNYNNG